jgi:hypothetical protein
MRSTLLPALMLPATPCFARDKPILSNNTIAIPAEPGARVQPFGSADVGDAIIAPLKVQLDRCRAYHRCRAVAIVNSQASIS